jgi:N-acetylneuraminic acid mutarotase
MPYVKIPSDVSGKIRVPIVLSLFLFLAAVLILPQTTAAAGVWRFTGSMNTARSGDTGTLLKDGRVLVMGNSIYGNAEIYNPTSGTWSITGSMNIARNVAATTLLPNDQVLVAGGSNGSYLSSAEIYNPTSGTWSATSSLKHGRGNHAAILLNNGEVLVAGGADIFAASQTSAELYDSTAGTWGDTAPLHHAREYFTATLLPNGEVLVAGGLYGYFDGMWYFSFEIANSEIYNPNARIWTDTGSLNGARCNHTATLLPDGHVLVVGGFNHSWNLGPLKSAELYDPATRTWRSTGSLTTARSAHTATLLPNGKVLVVGGGTYAYGGYCETFASAEIYDPATETWIATGSLNDARNNHTAILLTNGQVLVTGGSNLSNGSLKTAELYKETTGVSPGIFQLLLGEVRQQ